MSAVEPAEHPADAEQPAEAVDETTPADTGAEQRDYAQAEQLEGQQQQQELEEEQQQHEELEDQDAVQQHEEQEQEQGQQQGEPIEAAEDESHTGAPYEDESVPSLDGARRERRPVVLRFGEETYDLFSASEEGRKVVLEGQSPAYWGAPIADLAAALKAELHVANDVSLEFPALGLLFTMNLVFGQQVFLSHLEHFLESIEEGEGQPQQPEEGEEPALKPLEIVMADQGSCFEAQYDALLALTKKVGYSEEDPIVVEPEEYMATGAMDDGGEGQQQQQQQPQEEGEEGDAGAEAPQEVEEGEDAAAGEAQAEAEVEAEVAPEPEAATEVRAEQEEGVDGEVLDGAEQPQDAAAPFEEDGGEALGEEEGRFEDSASRKRHRDDATDTTDTEHTEHTKRPRVGDDDAGEEAPEDDTDAVVTTDDGDEHAADEPLQEDVAVAGDEDVAADGEQQQAQPQQRTTLCRFRGTSARSLRTPTTANNHPLPRMLFEIPLVCPKPVRAVNAVLMPSPDSAMKEETRAQKRKEMMRRATASPEARKVTTDAEIFDIFSHAATSPADTAASFVVPLPRVGSSSPTSMTPPDRAVNPFTSTNSDWRRDISQLSRPAAAAPRLPEDMLGAELGLLSLSPAPV
eukprot:m51a1_g13853 hypothetical protein (631) ;mRNA; f:575500-579220